MLITRAFDSSLAVLRLDTGLAGLAEIARGEQSSVVGLRASNPTLPFSVTATSASQPTYPVSTPVYSSMRLEGVMHLP